MKPWAIIDSSRFAAAGTGPVQLVLMFWPVSALAAGLDRATQSVVLNAGIAILSIGGLHVPLLTAAFAVLGVLRSEEHTSELQSPMRISYAGFCWKKKK